MNEIHVALHNPGRPTDGQKENDTELVKEQRDDRLRFICFILEWQKKKVMRT